MIPVQDIYKSHIIYTNNNVTIATITDRLVLTLQLLTPPAVRTSEGRADVDVPTMLVVTLGVVDVDTDADLDTAAEVQVEVEFP